MNQSKFLSRIFDRKPIELRSKRTFTWKNGRRRDPEKKVECVHCKIPMARPRIGLVSSAVCCTCIERDRMARVLA